MKISKVAFLAAFFVSLTACSQGSGPGGAAAEVDDSPEGQAFQYRHSVMEAIAWKVGKLRAMAQGEAPADNATAAKYARDTATLAGMIGEGFIPNSAVKGSLALPEIWTNMSDFEAKAKDLETASTSLADAIQANGFEAAKGMVQAVGQTCGGCHRPYRRRQE